MGILEKFKDKSPGKKALLMMGVLFFLLYFSLGIMFVFVKNLPFTMSPALRLTFGIVLIAYGIFRGVRVWQDLNIDKR